MDSTVGALGLAYFYTIKTKLKWTPIVNCRREDFKLRVDIYKHVVSDCGIDDLLFWDEVQALKPEITEIALFDHNMLDDA